MDVSPNCSTSKMDEWKTCQNQWWFDISQTLNQQKGVKWSPSLRCGCTVGVAASLIKVCEFSRKHQSNSMTVGGFIFCVFKCLPFTWGNDPVWPYNIFQMGWFNNQLDHYLWCHIHIAPKRDVIPTRFLGPLLCFFDMFHRFIALLATPIKTTTTRIKGLLRGYLPALSLNKVLYTLVSGRG